MNSGTLWIESRVLIGVLLKYPKLLLCEIIDLISCNLLSAFIIVRISEIQISIFAFLALRESIIIDCLSVLAQPRETTLRLPFSAGRMSIAAKATFALCCTVSIGIISYVHYKQAYDR